MSEYIELADILNDLDEEYVYYNHKLYFVDEHDEEYIYLYRVTIQGNRFGINGYKDIIDLPINDYNKLKVVSLQ